MSTPFDVGYRFEKDGEFLKAIEQYEIAAEAGDDRAECRLGSIYRFGRGVPKDYERALAYYHRSAEKGNSYAESNIGSMYRFGQGVNKDYDTAFSWYTRSAEKDNEYAQQNLGSMYRFGEGREKDTDLAFYWYNKAAAQGNMFSEANLGSMYRLGDGVKRDYEKAFYWYSRAAAQGYAYAKYELGILYYHGFSVEKDYETAYALLKEYEDDTVLDFAKNGEAFYYLGECHKHGLGTKKDLLLAKSYYEKALEAGFNCRLTLDMLRRDLGDRGAMGITREYAAKLISKNISTGELLKRIEIDLKADFSYHWEMLKPNARQALVSGMFYYVITVGYGEEVYRSLDFTNVVALLSKALETELMEFFGRFYVEYLKDIRRIPASNFDPDAHRFVRYSPAWKKEKENIVYSDEMSFFGFSLGALYHLIGVENIYAFGNQDPEKRAYRKKIKGRDKTINPLMRDYSKLLFRHDAFGEGDFNESVVNYLIDFAEDIKCIKDIRNPADHGVIVDRSHAEFCSDVIIKVYKIFIDFLDKLTPEYVEKSLKAPQHTLNSMEP